MDQHMSGPGTQKCVPGGRRVAEKAVQLPTQLRIAFGKEPRISVDQVLTVVARVEHGVEIPGCTAKRELDQDDSLVQIANGLVDRRNTPANLQLLGRECKMIFDSDARVHLELSRPRL